MNSDVYKHSVLFPGIIRIKSLKGIIDILWDASNHTRILGSRYPKDIPPLVYYERQDRCDRKNK